MSLLNMTDSLISSLSLTAGQSLVSFDGRFHLTLQTNGDLIILNMDSIIWSSRTSFIGSSPYVLKMQNDGNLIVYDKDSCTIWQSNTACEDISSFYLAIQSDGNAVIYDSKEKPIWASYTQQ